VVFSQAGQGTQAAAMAAAFARVAAQEGNRVLLIEGNLRTPAMVGLLAPGPVGSLHSVYGKENVPWQMAVEHDPAVAGLDLLLVGAGALPGWSITPRLTAMLAEAQAEYDLVVLDSPSAATASEPLALAGMVTATVLVLGADGTGHDAAREAAERLRGASVNDVAAILDHSC
jgi:Mrp family chromosome partitioning ATPase